jgi:hypothetical protein
VGDPEALGRQADSPAAAEVLGGQRGRTDDPVVADVLLEGATGAGSGR